MEPKQKASIARILVGGERGTGFLVSREGLVLTALHCVAFADSFKTGKPEFLPGIIKVRFGDPLDPAVGPPGADGKLFATTATVVQHSVEHDIALLECNETPDVEPLVLAPSPFGVARWSTFGFPEASGAVADGSREVNGQPLDGRITSMSTRIALALNQVGAMDLRGISGAPILVGGVVVGVVQQTLTKDGVVTQNSLFGVHVATFASALTPSSPTPNGSPPKKLPWKAQPLPEQAHLLATLSELKAAQLVLAAKKLRLSTELDGLDERTTIGLLTCPLMDALNALKGTLGTFLPTKPPREVFGLMLCSSRLPVHVAETAAPALDGDQPPGKSVWVGAREAATARSLAFRFAVQAGLGEVHEALADLGALAGAEDGEAEAKKVFKSELMGRMACEEAGFEATRARWVKRNRDIYVLAEIGSPPNLAEILKEIYPRVRVVLRGPPPIESTEALPSDVITIPECAPAELESDFQTILDDLR
ncbi:serine protease [Sorangium sp. So ce448]|uniref:S1 family peptidase n=1 Tax=Sorangium sp. So ce448 TaxID=3133314 RepID=UPI003F5D739E